MMVTLGRRGSAAAWRTGTELVVAVLVAVATTVVVQLAISRIHLPFPTQVPGVLTSAGALVAVLVLLTLAVRRWRPVSTLVAWVGLAGLTTWMLALPLMGTRYYFAGLRVDMEFRTQLMTRYTASPAWADMTYAGLPPYYPATWFWIGGRLGALLGVPGWAMYKPWAIATMAVSVVVATVLWSGVVRRPVAALLGLATVLVGLHNGSGEPYAWFLVALMAPVVVIAWRGLAVVGPLRRRTLSGVGGFLGLCVAVYTLYAGFLAVVLVLLALVGVLQRRRAGAAWGATAAATAVRLALVAGPAAVVGLAVWGPYLLAAARRGFPTSSAPRFLPEGGAPLPFPMLEANGFGLVCVVGAAWLVVAAVRGHAVARALATLALAVYLWYVLSALALVGRSTLLAFRVDVVLQMALAAASVFGVLALLRRLPVLAQVPAEVVRAGAFVATAIVALSLLAPTTEGIGSADNVSYLQAYPTGRSAAGPVDPADPGQWAPGIVDAVARSTTSAPRDTIVLGGPAQLYAAEPYLGFQASLDQFANPLADYDGRNAQIEQWTHAPDLARALDASPYAPPRVLVLRSAPDGLHLPLTEDQFPAYPNRRAFDVVFPAALVASPAFVTSTVGPYVVAVRR